MVAARFGAIEGELRTIGLELGQKMGRGRDAGRLALPAQIRTDAANAYGSMRLRFGGLGCLASKRICG